MCQNSARINTIITIPGSISFRRAIPTQRIPTLILIFADLHLGRFDDQDASLLTDMEACIDGYLGNPSSQLHEIIFLGDVFDSYMEYPNDISMLTTQFANLLKSYQKQGITVSYHVGNHDPWHSTFFRRQLNDNLFLAPVKREIYTKRAYLSHGDEVSSYTLRGRVARYFMRSPFWYRLYTMILPPDVGQKIPAWISRKYAGLSPRQETIDGLKYPAFEILNTSDFDLVLFGHAHQSASELTSDGQYINTGSWLLNRSYIEISEQSVTVRLYSNQESLSK